MWLFLGGLLCRKPEKTVADQSPPDPPTVGGEDPEIYYPAGHPSREPEIIVYTGPTQPHDGPRE